MPHHTWYVSATHRGRRRLPTDPDAPPYGVRHARRPGEPFTACGEGALGWVIFWDLPFAPSAPETCERCSELVLLERSGSAPVAKPVAKPVAAPAVAAVERAG